MPKKRLGAEQIVTKLRQVEVLQSVNAGVNLQQFSGVKVQHGRTQEGPRYRGPFGLTSVSMLRHPACFHCRHEALLTLFQKLQHSTNPPRVEPGLAGDCHNRMTPPLQAADRLELLESPRRMARNVLDKAHDKGFVVSGLYHLRRNARLPQGVHCSHCGKMGAPL